MDHTAVGSRVVVRYRMDDGVPTDVLGTLTGFGTTLVVVSDADGLAVTIPATSVVAAKRIPPRPPRRAPRRPGGGPSPAGGGAAADVVGG